MSSTAKTSFLMFTPAILCLFLLLLSPNLQRITGNAAIQTPSQTDEVGKLITKKVTAQQPDVSFNFVLPADGDYLLSVDIPGAATYGYSLANRSGMTTAGSGAGGTVSGAQNNSRVMPRNQNEELFSQLSANSVITFNVRADPSLKISDTVTVGVFALKSTVFDGKSMRGELTASLPYAEYVVDVSAGPVMLKITDSASRQTTTALLIPLQLVFNGTSGGCSITEYTAVYTTIRVRTTGNDKCIVIVSGERTQGKSQTGKYEIMQSPYHALSLDDGPQSVTLSRDNPVVLVTFSQRTGKTVELSAQKISGNDVFVQYMAPSTTQSITPFGTESISAGTGGFTLSDGTVHTNRFPGTQNSTATIVLTYPQKGTTPTTVALSIKPIVVCCDT